MSAPSIPNLNSLRRGGPRVRGRGGTSSAETSKACSRQTHNRIIQATDTDAATSRLSAVAAGYLDDPFAHLLHDQPDGPPPRRLPQMNRGTYTRTAAIDRIVSTFLASHPSQRIQIISLGAGSDTRYFRLRRNHPDLDLLYHEFDLAENITSKIRHLSTPSFAAAYRQHCHVEWTYTTATPTTLQSDGYTLSALDLRDLHSSTTSPSPDTTSNPTPTPAINPHVPTLLISECCLCYLLPTAAASALQYFTTLISPPTPLAITLYEPIRPTTPFGRTMIANLSSRGISLPTLSVFPDLSQQRARLAGLGEGWQGRATDMNGVWKRWVGEAERERVEKLEWLDEVEEMEILGGQWCVAWGWRGGGDDDKEEGWKKLAE